MAEPEITQFDLNPQYIEYELAFEGTNHVWDVVAWRENAKVTSHIKGDLMVKEFQRSWDGVTVPVRGERPATSLERQWLSTLIEIFDYDGIGA